MNQEEAIAEAEDDQSGQSGRSRSRWYMVAFETEPESARARSILCGAANCCELGREDMVPGQRSRSPHDRRRLPLVPRALRGRPARRWAVLCCSPQSPPMPSTSLAHSLAYVDRVPHPSPRQASPGRLPFTAPEHSDPWPLAGPRSSSSRWSWRSCFDAGVPSWSQTTDRRFTLDRILKASDRLSSITRCRRALKDAQRNAGDLQKAEWISGVDLATMRTTDTQAPQGGRGDNGNQRRIA